MCIRDRPFTAAAAGDACPGAGKAAFAARAGVAALVVKNAEQAAAEAARLVGLLPANNLCGPALFDAAEPAKALDMAKYTGDVYKRQSFFWRCLPCCFWAF